MTSSKNGASLGEHLKDLRRVAEGAKDIQLIQACATAHLKIEHLQAEFDFKNTFNPAQVLALLDALEKCEMALEFYKYTVIGFDSQNKIAYEHHSAIPGVVADPSKVGPDIMDKKEFGTMARKVLTEVFGE